MQFQNVREDGCHYNFIRSSAVFIKGVCPSVTLRVFRNVYLYRFLNSIIPPFIKVPFLSVSVSKKYFSLLGTNHWHYSLLFWHCSLSLLWYNENKFFRGDVKAKLIDRRWQVAFAFYFFFVVCCFPFYNKVCWDNRAGNEDCKQRNTCYNRTHAWWETIAWRKNGIAKEITFYIDLFRVWNMWPDEFVLGKTIVKTLRVDPC